MNDSPSVMQDFVFGALESDANTLTAERNRWSGIRHSYDIDPLDPLPGQPVTVTVTVGRDVLVDHVTAYVTTDGSEPAGSRGQASTGFAVELRRVDTVFKMLYWDFAEIWQGQIPGQADGTHVRYRIEGWRNPSPTLPYEGRESGASVLAPLLLRGGGAGGGGSDPAEERNPSPTLPYEGREPGASVLAPLLLRGGGAGGGGSDPAEERNPSPTLPYEGREPGASVLAPLLLRGGGAGGGGSDLSNELRIDGTSEPSTLYGFIVDRFQTPAWAHEAIVYQIMVDRFAPAPDRWLEPAEMETFVGGTLRGVIDHLDYVASLGVTAIWLTPIFKVGSYHGYDTIDYREIDPRFGTKADLAELVQAAHDRGLRVILDFVANHSSHQFEFFQQALADPASAHRELYDFDPAYQHGYRSFFTDATMPQFNHDHPEARAYLLDAACYWLREFGVDGYRLDYAAGPNHDFWSAFGAACKKANPDCWTFGEVTLGSEALRTYTGRLDGCLDFGFVRQVRLLCASPTAFIPISRFASTITRTQRFFPASFTRPAFIDNHDMNRFLWAAGNDKQLLRMAGALLLAFGGSPILYYGTEVGLSQPRPKGHYREEARHPMLWGDSQDLELLADFKRLIAARRSHSALIYGEVVTLSLDDERGLWLSERVHGEDRVLVAVNSSLRNGRLSLPLGHFADLEGNPVTGSLVLPARSVVFLIPLDPAA